MFFPSDLIGIGFILLINNNTSSNSNNRDICGVTPCKVFCKPVWCDWRDFQPSGEVEAGSSGVTELLRVGAHFDLILMLLKIVYCCV